MPTFVLNHPISTYISDMEHRGLNPIGAVITTDEWERDVPGLRAVIQRPHLTEKGFYVAQFMYEDGRPFRPEGRDVFVNIANIFPFVLFSTEDTVA